MASTAACFLLAQGSTFFARKRRNLEEKRFFHLRPEISINSVYMRRSVLVLIGDTAVVRT